jgi:hypothetical protein
LALERISKLSANVKKFSDNAFTMAARHPYAWRTALRRRMPSFLIKMGIAAKGDDCEAAGSNHEWYNHDDVQSACYHCRVFRPGQLWRQTSTATVPADP